MPQSAALLDPQETATTESHAVAVEARRGLTASSKSLSPWLFYDEAGSLLFEQITDLPEYYLTRAEREIFSDHADEIFRPLGHNIALAELGAGTASKTGILLRALAQRQSSVLYQPIDISPTALDAARTQLEADIPGLTVRPHVANYIADEYRIDRAPDTRVLALYIGSSIGNFSPVEARAILSGLRTQLRTGDALLLGTDLAPCSTEVATPAKSVATLLSAYNDKQGVTAAFNLNVLTRLNRELGADFDLSQFAHCALWNDRQSRIEMHLKSLAAQQVTIPANSAGPTMRLNFFAGETIHTENSYKFNANSIADLLVEAGFSALQTFKDSAGLFSVCLATVA